MELKQKFFFSPSRKKRPGDENGTGGEGSDRFGRLTKTDGGMKAPDKQEQDIVWLRRMLSHNVRMPMSVICGYGELLRQGLLAEDEKEGCIQSICENITYMNEIMSVIFGDEKEAPLDLKKVNVAELVSKMREYVNEISKKNSIAVSVKTAGRDIFITAEPVPVMRIFYQLFENAFKYLNKGDSIQISIYPVSGGQVLIVFKDNGPGIEEQEVKKIFDREYRGSNSQGKKGGGLGLYDVKRIVEAYGGTVEATGRKGEGLSILIIFPQAC